MKDDKWKIVYTRQGLKDKKTAMQSGFSNKIISLLKILRINPFEEYPPYEKLIGDFSGAFSRRINRQHRLVYAVYKEEKIVKIIKIISMWTHYEYK